MKKIIILLLLVTPLFLHAQGRGMRIAILDLSGGSGVSPSLANDTTDLIRAEMINLNLFTVLERAQMKEILKEQGFQMSGCTDTSCAVKIGQLLSANKILVGKVSKFGKNYTINIRIVDVEKGTGDYAEYVDTQSQEEIPKQVRVLVKRLAGRITGTYFGEGEPVETTAQKPWENLGITQSAYKEMLKYGGSVMGFQQFINAGYDNINEYIHS